MTVDLIGQKAMNTVISHLDGVVASVSREAGTIGRVAQERLNEHREEGQAQIEVTHGDVDSFVSLVDPACLSIEFGHYTPNKKKYVPGLYIVTGAARLV